MLWEGIFQLQGVNGEFRRGICIFRQLSNTKSQIFCVWRSPLATPWIHHCLCPNWPIVNKVSSFSQSLTFSGFFFHCIKCRGSTSFSFFKREKLCKRLQFYQLQYLYMLTTLKKCFKTLLIDINSSLINFKYNVHIYFYFSCSTV